MKTVKYQIWEFPEHKPHNRKALLSVFIYDVPYLLACHKVLPPLYHLNSVFKSGGSTGGMGPGATWKPFEISEGDYKELVAELPKSDLNEIKKYSRFAEDRAIIDKSFDHIKDYFEWRKAVADKYKKKENSLN